ncbi:unnamed protein product [Rhizoctonia solani]|uniref:Uncharacterized protein n=1 Tax=Rhizoctonia solani TaxID=456999 RepID=A0A8H3B4S3_9AGAM|nr:unnamed protein product [Rhizoctonia solani]
MILDVEPLPKSPTSSGPTVRQAPGSSASRAPVSYATFPETHHSTRYHNNQGSSETRPLLYNPAQSIFDDVEPPAYDEIHTSPKDSASRNRFWTRCAAAFLLIFLLSSTLYSYNHSKIRQGAKAPYDTPREPSPPGTTTQTPPSPTSPPGRGDFPPVPSAPSVPLPPLPPSSPIPDLPGVSVILPTQGRTDLCYPWAYSSKQGVHPLASDNRPVDKLVYTVPTLAPIHMETSAICPTPEGTTKFCDQYDDTYDSIAGKLQVVGADIELPQIEITVQHGSVSGQDNIAVCLMNKPDENGEDRWVFGLYAWKDPTVHDQDSFLASMSIIVTLPRTQVHSLSTHLNYFTQTIGPEVKTDSNRLVFDTLRARLGERGSLKVRNVTVATVQTTALGDAQVIEDTRVTKSIQMQSETGFIYCILRLVHTEGSPPVQVNMQSISGTVTGKAVLEYSSRVSDLPQFDIQMHSMYSPASIMVQDPRGTSFLRQNPGLVPPVLPVIRVNSTSRLSIAQAVLPATYHGNLALTSKYAAVVTIDHAKSVARRSVSWDKPTNGGYRGAVRWVGRMDESEEASFVSATTEYATARLLFLGLDEEDRTSWPESDDSVIFAQS